MTTNQTIGGVPRALLEWCYGNAMAIVYRNDPHVKELRALLDAPACKTPSGATCPGDGVGPCKNCPAAQLDAPALERKPFGWFRTPKDCPLQGMFLHYDPEHGERDIQNALDFGFTVKRLYDRPAVQPRGVPVAFRFRWDYDHGNGWCRNAVRFVESMEHVEHEDKSTWRDITPLYAEQPAPVAMMMPERRAIGPNYPYLSDLDIEWNACLDEVARLNNK